MSAVCPCCGHAIVEPNRVDLHAAAYRFSPTHRIIVEALIQRYPNTVLHERLIDLIWGDDPDGGPLDARVNIAVRVSQIRKRIKPLGWSIINDWGTGFRLERIEADHD